MGSLKRSFHLYRPQWDLASMRGGHACLKWNLQDLHTLEQALARTRGRDAVVQAGGNLGLFPKRLAEEFAAVYTFEPDPVLFACLEHNAPEANIIPVQAALGCTREPVAMACGRRDESGRNVHEGLTYVSGTGVIPQVRIDDLNLHACNLIYLDIEGYELNALRGAEQTIARFRPTLAVEVNGNTRHYGASKDELRKWIVQRGYTLSLRMKGDDIYVPA